MAERLTLAVKPYLYIEELAALTPWTEDAIRTKVRRDELQRGMHYFQDQRGGRLIFKWAAIVELIERGRAKGADQRAPTPHHAPQGAIRNVEKATADLQRLLD